jgi:hypothetical protein
MNSWRVMPLFLWKFAQSFSPLYGTFTSQKYHTGNKLT